jgi:hypothetical protein
MSIQACTCFRRGKNQGRGERYFNVTTLNVALVLLCKETLSPIHARKRKALLVPSPAAANDAFQKAERLWTVTSEQKLSS